MYSQFFPAILSNNPNRQFQVARMKEREIREAPRWQKKEKKKTSIFYVHFDCVSQKIPCPIFREERKEYRQLFVCFLFTIPVSPSLAPPPPHVPRHTQTWKHQASLPSIFFFKKPVTLLYIVYLWIKFMTSSLTKKFTLSFCTVSLVDGVSCRIF
jgi:hypothetical protein